MIATAAVAGAIALSGAAAFTASNSLPDSVAGYGESSVSGASVTAIAYNPDSQDASRLGSVVFTAVPALDSSAIAALTLKNSSTLVESDSCIVFTASGISTITCTASGTPLLDSFNKTGLTVTG